MPGKDPMDGYHMWELQMSIGTGSKLHYLIKEWHTVSTGWFYFAIFMTAALSMLTEFLTYQKAKCHQRCSNKGFKDYHVKDLSPEKASLLKNKDMNVNQQQSKD